MYRVTLIKGDGIGPEVIEAAKAVVEAVGAPIEWEEKKAGFLAQEEEGTPLPPSLLESIKKNKVALKGPITTPIGSGFRSVNVALRQEMDLYAGVRPAKSFTDSRIDIVIIRENTEDLYSGVEHFVNREHTVAESIRIITKKASERIVRFAFEYAKKEGRKKVTVVHKANILKCTCGLFLDTAREVAAAYPEIGFDERIVDNMAMQLIKRPEDYDIVVTTNLFGDILSDLCAGLIGGLGLAPSGNIGDTCAIFEPVHGSAPKYAGQGRVNPTATILSAAMLLRHLGEKTSAEMIERAVKEVLLEAKCLTYDLGGTSSTMEMTEAIIKKLSSLEF